MAQLFCKVCDQRYQSKANRAPTSPRLLWLLTYHPSSVDLTEPIDIYSEWIDAADAAEKEASTSTRRAVASSSRAPRAPSVDSDD